MNKGFYITNKGTFSADIESLCDNIYFVVLNKNATYISVPERVNVLICTNNNLTEIKIPYNVHCVYCKNNNIKNIVISSKIKFIECDLMDGIEEQNRKGLFMNIYQK